MAPCTAVLVPEMAVREQLGCALDAYACSAYDQSAQPQAVEVDDVGVAPATETCHHLVGPPAENDET